MHHRCAPTWRFHTGFCKFLRTCIISTNMSSLGKRTGLKFGKVSSLFIFYNITITRLFPLDGFRFIFLLHDGENDLHVYFTVEICHCGPLPSATPGFSLWQKLCKSAEHQRCRSAWVGQAGFGKVEPNNGNHSGNCHRLSM